jgi:rare lipoprotein A
MKILLCLLCLLSSFDDDFVYSKASYYAYNFEGRKTASGELFSNDLMTAAHKTLKFGTMVEVFNLKNNKSIIVKINDRGPFIRGRDIDLSRAAFNSIGNINSGVIKIKYRVIKK